MHPTRIIIRNPSVCRLAKYAPQAAPAVRNMSLFSAGTPPFLIRGYPAAALASPSFTNELAPLFRLMDDFASSSSRALEQHFAPQQLQRQARPFAPRFDVRELDDAYELRGELPGVQSKDLEVEFADAQTLVIRGRTHSEKTTTTNNSHDGEAIVAASTAETTNNDVAATAADAAAPTADNSDAASTHSSSSYQKATVEDDEPVNITAADLEPATASSSTSAPAAATTNTQEVASSTTAAAPAAEAVAPKPHYWLSERRRGSFQRTFSFATRVNQEGVKASLQDGVLSVVVPKAVVPAPRRVMVE